MSSQPAAQPSRLRFLTFDPEIFWALHKQKILIGAALLIAALLGRQPLFRDPGDPEPEGRGGLCRGRFGGGWQAVIRQFPNSIAAGNSYLRIAVKLREDGKYSGL